MPAFDPSARDYDAIFSQHQLGKWLRAAVHNQLRNVFKAGQHVLELGCGTGEDALWLADRGVKVTATDSSVEMLAVAEEKRIRFNQAAPVRFRQWDFSNLHSLSHSLGVDHPSATFDGIFSNFGALNCLPDRRPLAKALLPWLKTGARVVMVLMGPLCPWEIVWHISHGKVRAAFRRFKKGGLAHVGAERFLQTWYPSPGTIKVEMGRDYRLERVTGLGFLLPPTYLRHLVDRFPSFFNRANRLEQRFRPHAQFAWISDHYILEFELQDVLSA